MLLETLKTIPDQRRAQGRQYDLAHTLFFSILAIASGADSYRRVKDFITNHFERLKKQFDLKWRQPPAYTTIRNIILDIDSSELEKAFRKYSKDVAKISPRKYKYIGLDGKTLRGSFDNFKDIKAIQMFSAFLEKEKIILAHEEIENCKTNEIPTAQKLIKELGLKRCVFTTDAMHCQKKL